LNTYSSSLSICNTLISTKFNKDVNQFAIFAYKINYWDKKYPSRPGRPENNLSKEPNFINKIFIFFFGNPQYSLKKNYENVPRIELARKLVAKLLNLEAKFAELAEANNSDLIPIEKAIRELKDFITESRKQKIIDVVFSEDPVYGYAITTNITRPGINLSPVLYQILKHFPETFKRTNQNLDFIKSQLK